MIRTQAVAVISAAGTGFSTDQLAKYSATCADYPRFF